MRSKKTSCFSALMSHVLNCLIPMHSDSPPRSTVLFYSPAKINLFLKVVSKRDDGFHNLSSLLQTISFGDFLEIQLSDQDEFFCSDPSLKMDEKNLVIKALSLYRAKTCNRHPFSIKLTKNIPSEAGLGGGSGNAATTLWACNQLLGTLVCEEDLRHWSASIGSDIPFFFSSGRAHCTGRGEFVQSVFERPQHDPFWIVKPNFGLSTPLVFKHFRFDSSSSCSLNGLELATFLKGEGEFFNDLEKPAFGISPVLTSFKQLLLERGFEHVLMTGAGSSFICMGPGKFKEEDHFFKQYVHFIYRDENDWYKPLK